MSVQYRIPWLGHEATPWKDLEMGEVEFGSYLVEFREKSSFEPGYYRQKEHRIGAHKIPGFVKWWFSEPDLDHWERVEVTKVDA